MKLEKKRNYYELDLGISREFVIGIILALITLGINIFYFSVNTGVWWDEAEYLSFVNHIVDDSPYSMWEGRAILYPLILSIFGFINNSESFLRIGLIIISCLTVFFSFLVINKLFKEKVAIISTVFLIFNNLFEFFSLRFLTGIPSLLFIMIGLFFFFSKKSNSRIFAGLFIGFSIAIRFTSVFIVPALIIYDLVSKKSFKSYFWIPMLLVAFIPTIVFDVFNGNLPWETLFIFFTQSTSERTWGHNLGEWYYYLINSPGVINFILIPFFILGLFYLLSRIKSSDKSKYLLILTFLVLHFLSYSFLTQLKEERYMIPILPFIFAISSFGIIIFTKNVGNFVKKKFKFKYLEQILVLFIVLYVSYNSFIFSNSSILYSSSSYQELSFAGNEIKMYTLPSEIIITNAGPHISYYSEREVIGFPSNISELYELLENNTNINYLVFSFYETPPSYLNSFYNNTNFTVVRDYTRNDNTMLVILGYLRE